MIDHSIERDTMRQVSVRLLPLLFLLYILCYLDRSNVSIAALQMNKELNFNAATFGFGAGIFFLGYALFEVPSNLILARVGARQWFARIAISSGPVAAFSGVSCNLSGRRAWFRYQPSTRGLVGMSPSRMARLTPRSDARIENLICRYSGIPMPDPTLAGNPFCSMPSFLIQGFFSDRLPARSTFFRNVIP